MHKIELSPEVLKRVYNEYRGTLHMFENLDPRRTAHIIVDLQNGFMEVGATVELPIARDIVPNVNEICKAVRAAGAINIFIRYLIDEPTHKAWSTWFTDFASSERAKAMNETFGRGCHGFELWPGLDVQSDDLIVDKTRFGAFVPGSSKLHEILQERGIDTLIITGTATNVCCEFDRARRHADELQGHLRRRRQCRVVRRRTQRDAQQHDWAVRRCDDDRRGRRLPRSRCGAASGCRITGYTSSIAVGRNRGRRFCFQKRFPEENRCRPTADPGSRI